MTMAAAIESRNAGAPASLVHVDDVVSPALQRPEHPVEKPRGDFAGFERLETPGAAGAHAFQAQDYARAAAADPAAAGEISEFKPQPRQQDIVGLQIPALSRRSAAA